MGRPISYYTRQNDIWALGVILVNLTCGRNPWRQASGDDDTFVAFVHDPDFLQNILPISASCNEILKRIFSLNPQRRISLPDLRQAIQSVTCFTMSNEELRRAPEACKSAARAAWSEAQKAVRRHPITIPSIIIEPNTPTLLAAEATPISRRPSLTLVTQHLSSSAGPESLSSSHSSKIYNLRASETVVSIAPFHSTTADDIWAEGLQPLSTASSGSTVAQSSGPTTPEWNPNADQEGTLPDVEEEPFALDESVVVQVKLVTVEALKNGIPRINEGQVDPVKEVATGSSLRGVKDLWRKVRF